MLAAIKRHPIPMQAEFEYSLVLTYAFRESLLAPLLPPGLTIDAYQGLGFLAIALVQTRRMRPVGVPRFLGRDFFLSGYRIFARHTRPSGQRIRGLRILRSDTDSRLLALVGNRLTRYNYRHCTLESTRNGDALALSIRTPGGEADLALRADLGPAPELPPPGSPFPDWRTARGFAGPLPFTFDYEAKTHSLVIIEGVRKNWEPRPIAASVERVRFFDRSPFSGEQPLLANAFFVENIPYRWKRGEVESLPRTAA